MKTDVGCSRPGLHSVLEAQSTLQHPGPWGGIGHRDAGTMLEHSTDTVVPSAGFTVQLRHRQVLTKQRAVPTHPLTHYLPRQTLTGRTENPPKPQQGSPATAP